MRSRDGFLWLLTWSLAAFAVVYVLKPPGPLYVVPEGVWQWTVPPGTPAIAWFSRLTYALAAAGVGALIALLLHNASAGIRRFIDSRTGVRCMTALILATLAVSGAWMTYLEWAHWLRG